MKEFAKAEIEYFLKTIENYYYLQHRANDLRREAFILDIKIQDEMKGQGISYDKNSGTYNNTDTPYINQLIHEQQSYELEAVSYEWGAKDLNKYNKIEKRLSGLSACQRSTVLSICKNCMSFKDYANQQKISKQAANERFHNAIKCMLDMEV